MIALKLILVPSFLFIVSISSVRWGAAVAGWLAGLPVVAGPILYLLVVEQGAVFGASAAAAALSAIFASEAFNLAYGWTCRSRHYSIAAVMGLLTWLVAAIGLTSVPTTPVYAVGAALAGIALAQRFLPRTQAVGKATSITGIDLMLRMVAGAALTLAVTTLSAFVGAQWSGLVTVFPVLAMILSCPPNERTERTLLSGFCVAWCWGASRLRPFASALCGRFQGSLPRWLLWKLHLQPWLFSGRAGDWPLSVGESPVCSYGSKLWSSA